MKLSVVTLFMLVFSVTATAEDALKEFRSKNVYAAPFVTGTWWVAQGGDTPNVNHHMMVPEQMFGIDIMRTEKRGLSANDGTHLSDYYSYGQTVVSPCAGEILEVVNDQVDQMLGKTDTEHPYGNHLIIAAPKGEFVVLAHFKPTTISVKPHDQIQVGQTLGLVGNSGNSDFPHVHMHVQNAAALNSGRGLLFELAGVQAEIAGTLIKNKPTPLLCGMWLSHE